MAKIARYNGDLKAFGADSLGTERTVFGDELTQSDTLDANITADYLRGWGILGAGEKPPKQFFNGMTFTVSQLLAYLHQMGVAEWNVNQEYHADSIATRSGLLYQSKTNTNTGNDPATDTTNWKLVSEVVNQNFIINGDFDFWQEKTGLTLPDSNAHYVADMITHQRNSQATDINRQAFAPGQTDVPGEPTYYVNVNKLGAEVVANIPVEFRIPDVRTLAGEEITFSFWAKAAAPKTFNVQVNQNFGSGGSVNAAGPTSNINVTTSWQRFEITGTMPSISGKTIGPKSHVLAAILETSGFGLFSLDVAQAKLEIGSRATRFLKYNMQNELAECQRFYSKTFDQDVLPGQNTGDFNGSIPGVGYTGGNLFEGWRYPVIMDSTPIVTTYSPNEASANWSNNVTTPIATVGLIGDAGARIGSSGGMTPALSYAIHATADARL
jgi:hypothetical protein